MGILGMRELAVVPMAEDSADDGRQKDHRFKTPRPLPCGNGRRDEHGAHEDNAYGLDGEKDGDRGKEGEEYIQLAPRKSENCGIVRIKSHKFQFFLKRKIRKRVKIEMVPVRRTSR